MILLHKKMSQKISVFSHFALLQLSHSAVHENMVYVWYVYNGIKLIKSNLSMCFFPFFLIWIFIERARIFSRTVCIGKQGL